jgi:predicted O-methyltransferase YrrM
MIPARLKELLRQTRRAARRVKANAVKRLTRPNVYRLSTPERVGVVFSAPSDMRVDERLFLYSLVRGFQPERALEIGVLRGGGGAIMANAMEENGRGLIIGLDPAPDLRVRPRDLHGRYRVITRPSPEGLPEARDAAGGAFDFVLVDGLHQYSQVRRDIEGVLPHVADGAYVLFHDAFHYGVATAIREAVESNPNLHDCGYACRTARIHSDPVTPYNGFRLLRFATSRVADVEREVARIYAAEGEAPPPLRRDALDHDVWYCRAVKPCARCAARIALDAEPEGASARVAVASVL